MDGLVRDQIVHWSELVYVPDEDGIFAALAAPCHVAADVQEAAADVPLVSGDLHWVLDIQVLVEYQLTDSMSSLPFVVTTGCSRIGIALASGLLAETRPHISEQKSKAWAN